MGPGMDYVVKYLLPIFALGASLWAIIEARRARGTAEAALRENKRQHATGPRPAMSINVEVEGQGTGQHSAVYVCNDGGVAQNVWYDLTVTWPSPPKTKSRSYTKRLGSLSGRHEVTRVRHSGVQAWGAVTAEDMEHALYWWRQPPGDAPMQSGTGPLPSDG
jgi:hypothetical protein